MLWFGELCYKEVQNMFIAALSRPVLSLSMETWAGSLCRLDSIKFPFSVLFEVPRHTSVGYKTYTLYDTQKMLLNEILEAGLRNA